MPPVPSEGEVLKELLAHSDKHFGRVDTYLEKLQKFLSTSPKWTPQHEKLFDEMIKSARTSRIQAIGAGGIAALLIVFIFVYAWFIVPLQQRRLVEDLRNANLEIEFQESASDLLIKYASDSDVDEAVGVPSRRNRLLKQANLFDVVIGRYAGGLGTGAVLRFHKPSNNGPAQTASTWRWNVKPQNDDSIVGTLTMANKAGSIDLDEVYFDDPIPHRDLSEFMLRIVSVSPATWIGEASNRSAQYQVTFGVQPEGKSKLVWSSSFFVRYSGKGHIKHGPFLVSSPEWSSAYVANVGIGYWGSDERRGERVAYYVKSDAYRISLNDSRSPS